MLKSPDALLLYFMALGQIFYGYYVINVYKTLGAQHIKSDRFLTLVGSIGSLFNGISRIFWSTLLDYIAFKKVFRTLLAI